MQPLVSVIIPCYNAVTYIERTLASVYQQTYTHLDVICVDNNSTDGTAAFIAKLQQRYNWPLCLLHESRQGAPHARNLGLAHARGTYIQFLDADDFLVPHKLHQQVTLLQTENLHFVTAEHFEISGTEKRAKPRRFTDSWQGLITGAIGITSSALFQKSILLEVGGFAPHLASNQEKDLYFRLLQAGARHAQLPVPLFEKNFSPHSISAQTNRRVHLLTKLQFLNRVALFLAAQPQNSARMRLVHTQAFLLFKQFCKLVPARDVALIFAYFVRKRRFNIRKSSVALKTKLAVIALTPVGFFLWLKMRAALRP